MSVVHHQQKRILRVNNSGISSVDAWWLYRTFLLNQLIKLKKQMTELQIFENERFGEVRMILIDGKPFFIGSDIAKCLGYSRTNDAIARHCKNTVKQRMSDNQGVTRIVNIIPEPDFYRLVFNSELPEAESFQDWVFDEVLPSIREKGFYAREEQVKTLKAYVLEQATEWEKTFQDEFYTQFCRLWGQEIGTKPQFFGHLTNKYIYSRLPEGVPEDIKEKALEKGSKWHQWLTDGIGKNHLKEVINQVTVLMKVSATKVEFDNIYNQAYNGKPRQYNIFDNY